MAADLTEAIYTRAAANSGLTAVLGSSPFRFFPVQAPQKSTKPYVVWAVISEPRLHAGGGYAGLTRSRVVFDCYASTQAGAVTLDRLVRDAFNAFTGASVVCTGGTVTILSMEVQSTDDAYEATTESFIRSRDILFWWRDNA